MQTLTFTILMFRVCIRQQMESVQDLAINLQASLYTYILFIHFIVFLI